MRGCVAGCSDSFGGQKQNKANLSDLNENRLSLFTLVTLTLSWVPCPEFRLSIVSHSVGPAQIPAQSAAALAGSGSLTGI